MNYSTDHYDCETNYYENEIKNSSKNYIINSFVIKSFLFSFLLFGSSLFKEFCLNFVFDFSYFFEILRYILNSFIKNEQNYHPQK